MEKELIETSTPVEIEPMRISFGPSHPAMHGTIKIDADLDGETVVSARVEIGYLHRAFEKSCEQGNYMHPIPYTDRLNYVSPLICNFGYAQAVEKLLGIDLTERCKYIRVIMSELSRITDHLTCIGASTMELGAFSVFLYMIKAREYIYELVEYVTGARLTISYVRIGGVKADFQPDFEERTRVALKKTREVLAEVDRLLTKNRIFHDRMKGVGVCTPEIAVQYGITGPFLRSCGVNYDVRKIAPYLVYDRLNFEVPLGENGDNYDRYLCRMREMEQSMRIIEQAFDQMPKGEVNADVSGHAVPAAEMRDLGKIGATEGLVERSAGVEPTLQGSNREAGRQINVQDKRIFLPPKDETYSNIEGLMNHFKMVMYGHGLHPPKGETYSAVEGGNGELGFFVVSDGTDRPYRVRCRPPCFPIMAALPHFLIGYSVADIVPTFGSVNMIGGELDR
ncbi:MAG TPA: NADH-quinone oxidoreductase subunit D [Acidobacteriota bacterium]|jgi:NADH-quinone oxidoreductase subunit D|nr:NADH-quinone oxidoreductase subunit D [Acidobacteriota bacterium]